VNIQVQGTIAVFSIKYMHVVRIDVVVYKYVYVGD